MKESCVSWGSVIRKHGAELTLWSDYMILQLVMTIMAANIQDNTKRIWLLQASKTQIRLDFGNLEEFSLYDI